MTSHLVENLLVFGRLLRTAGLDVHMGRMLDVLKALQHVDIGARDEVYHTCRTLLVHRREDLPIFDRAFDLFWRRRDAQSSRVRIDLGSGEIRTILWATGFRPDYSWLHVSVVDAKGNLRHDGGVVSASPGMVVLGLPVLRRRKSSFIYGAEDDARELVDHLARFLDGP